MTKAQQTFWFSIATLASGILLATWGGQPELGGSIALAAVGAIGLNANAKRSAAAKAAKKP